MSRCVVVRDLVAMHRENGRLFDPRRFDAVGFVTEKIAQYESLYRKAVKDAHSTRDVRARLMAYHIAVQVMERSTALPMDTGFIDRRLGTLAIAPDDGKTAERVPNGVQRQKLFASVTMPESELSSEPELGRKYGEPVEAEEAAKEAAG